jgi:hypothetical protein
MSSHQNPSVIDESHALGVKRISPISDTPRSVTPVDPMSAQLHREIPGPKGKGNATVEKQNTATRKTSKLNQTAKPPASPPESSIILRPRTESPKPSGVHAAFYLPSFIADWRRTVFVAQYITLFKIVIFFLKLLSLTRPCIPSAPRPFIFYPIVLIALLDFMAPQLMLTVILGIVHVGLLSLVIMVGGLCMY